MWSRDGGTLLRVDVTEPPSGECRTVRLDATEGRPIADLEPSAARRTRALVEAGAAALLVGLADAGADLLAEEVRSHRAGPAFGQNRWSGQALGHRLADLALLRESCRLELLRALDASDWAAAELHLAVALHEGLRAGRAAVDELERATALDAGEPADEAARDAARTLRTVDTLVGGLPRLRERLSDYVFDAASNRPV
jgi:hypothetical protein